MPDGPKKIAILGGGTGALSAAFGLTAQPDWQQHYDITVYQLGWRLGGKGASGRNQAHGQRIEEHGLHVWAGFYENAFHVIRECYRELGRRPDAPLATWRDAFKPHSFITVEEHQDGRWLHWNVNLPTNPCLPGDGGPLPTPWEYVPRLLSRMIETFVKHRHDAAPGPDDAVPPPHAWLPGWLNNLVGEAGAVGEALGAALSHLPFLQTAWKLANALPRNPLFHPPTHHRTIIWLVNRFMSRLYQSLAAHMESNATLRRLWLLLDLAAATIRGLLADGVIFKGFNAIDDWEWSDWLRKHGISELTLQSPLVRGTYDYIFGFRQGDPGKPAVAAGTCVRGLLRLTFTAKGAVFWEMQAGMGDTVFTPLYQVLQQRGVKFEFFQRVRRLELSADKKTIARIHLGRQATLKDPAASYQALVTIKELDCWPSAPRYEQLVEGDELQARGIDLESWWADWPDRAPRVLELGTDFHDVVLGISLGALKEICSELVEASPAWKGMVENVQTVRTQALQLWLKRDALGLGWDYLPTILTAYAEPLDTWGDLSHLVKREQWPDPDVPASIAYFCGPLPDEEAGGPAPAASAAYVKEVALAWLRQNTGHLWPRAITASGELDWNLLVDLNNGSGPARLDGQYWRANVNPSDRYVLSLPGTTRHRLKAGASGFTNLYLAGDWVLTGLNAGCVEAAVMAGLQASRALSGHPHDIPGETDLPPLPPAPTPVHLGLAVRTRILVHRAVRQVRHTLGTAWRAWRRPRLGRRAYVEVGGEQVFCQPLALNGVRFFSFLLHADYGALRALCDKYLNHPARGAVEYVPLVPRVMLGFADIARAGCAKPPDSDKGWMQEIDVAFWVPVAKIRRALGNLVFVERIAWFLPYVFVNNAWASASGREIYGFPKELGAFAIPTDEQPFDQFTADSLVLDRYQPQTEAKVKRIAEVRRVSGTGGPPARTYTDAHEALAEFLRGLTGESEVMVPGLGLVREAFKFLAHHEVPFVFLKQFRDVADGRQACHQAIVEAPARLVKLHAAAPLPGDFLATVNPYDSHPILGELGLKQGEQPVALAWYSVFDFVMETGREVWTG